MSAEDGAHQYFARFGRSYKHDFARLLVHTLVHLFTLNRSVIHSHIPFIFTGSLTHSLTLQSTIISSYQFLNKHILQCEKWLSIKSLRNDETKMKKRSFFSVQKSRTIKKEKKKEKEKSGKKKSKKGEKQKEIAKTVFPRSFGYICV